MTTPQTDVQDWIATLNLNHWIIERQLDGLTHDDTLLALPFRGNRLNWVLGHLAEHRDWMLRALDLKTLMPAQEAMRYRRGSDPLTDDHDAVQLDTLMGYLQRSKECLISKLSEVSTDFLSEKPDTGLLLETQRERTRLQRLQGLIWHETYHVGQLEFLRQLAGTDDAVLS